MGLNSGPVHLNFPFREPLFLQNSDIDPVIAEFPSPSCLKTRYLPLMS